MDSQKILKASNIQELKSLGDFHDLRKSIEDKLDNDLCITDWNSFLDRVTHLKKVTAQNKECLRSISRKNSFIESKVEISNILGIKVNARSWDELEKKVSYFIKFFSSNAFDPYEHYENTKTKKFRDSSKLEGIDIETSDENATLESVLAKYRR